MFTRLSYELRVMGKRVIWLPIALAAGFIAFAFLLRFLGVHLERFISSGFELFLPIVTGIVVATSATQDPALEIQLTMPRKYHNTSILRLALIVAWSIAFGLLISIIPTLLHLTFLPDQLKRTNSFGQFFGLQFSWIATTFWFVAVALVSSLLTRSRSASSAILGAVWIVQILFMTHLVETTSWLQPLFLFPTIVAPQISYWMTNRLEVLSTGIVLLPVGWWLLHNTEGLLKGASEE
ncbi:hypothetical protein KDH_08140 [Dictyobacter sp. S3.2.2.5]|uniref:ABC transporter permease n=1 Tax=Dictyobacter halimunensis TaxID=3026934 RepID=A0ABQ6FJZ1_9CHLR|nr:hypothetical protein KDH_08140 [Dictyobacter sp. S3.2.2.5]